MRSVILTAALMASSMTSLHAADDTKVSGHAKAARDFTFEGTKIGSSLGEFMKRHPDATELSQTNRKVGLVALCLKSESATVCGYFFSEGKLYEFRIIYKEKEIDKIGGGRVFVTRILDKFGLPTDTQKGKEGPSYTWKFQDVNRRVIFRVRGEDGGLFVTDTKLESELTARLAKSAKTGFDH